MKRNRVFRGMVAGMVAVMAVTMLTGMTATAATATDFKDIANHSSKVDIEYAVERGLFSGVSTDRFAPQEQLTRGMAAMILSLEAKVQGTAADASKETGGLFSDVPKGAYYAAAVDWVVESGIMAGVSDSRFEPDRAISSGEFSTALKNYLKWLGRVDAPLFEGEGTKAMTRGESAVALATLDRFLLARNTEVLTHKAADGVTLTGKLDLPKTGKVERIVLYINGSGPNTYDNRRATTTGEFNYHDLFAEQLGARGIGFFRWNTRGVSEGTQGPNFTKIDQDVYKTYVPETSISDIHEWILELKQDARLKDAKVYLLGWSEGTMIASHAAARYADEIDGILLAGYCNDKMGEILNWQQTGGSSMVFYSHYFDVNEDGIISKEEFDGDRHGIKPYLKVEFEELDVNGDHGLTAQDFAVLLKEGREAIYAAIKRNDDKWIAENYGVALTGEWFAAHEKLKPNRELLPTLKLPIEIFHGTMDQNCDVNGVYAVEKTFQEKGKNNLKTHIYSGADHDLNYMQYVISGVMPRELVDLFQACGTIK